MTLQPDRRWTTSDIPDLAGKVMIVTGANTGIGFEAAKELARKGARTILACRSAAKAQAALDRIQDDVPGATAETMLLDLASLKSVHRFASDFKSRFERLDLLINNAGIMMPPYQLTEDGFERQFGTNHLGHFALTGLLLDRLLDTPKTRVVTVSSSGHRMGRMDFANLMYQDGGYSPQGAYGRSSLANLLFTYELQRRLAGADSGVSALAAHPGISATDLSRHLEERWYVRLAAPILYRWSQSAAMGALPTLRAAVDPGATGGQYYGPGGFMEQRGYPVVVTSNGASHDEADARRLWQVSEELTGVRYTQFGERPAHGAPQNA